MLPVENYSNPEFQEIFPYFLEDRIMGSFLQSMQISKEVYGEIIIGMGVAIFDDVLYYPPCHTHG